MYVIVVLLREVECFPRTPKDPLFRPEPLIDLKSMALSEIDKVAKARRLSGPCCWAEPNRDKITSFHWRNPFALTLEEGCLWAVRAVAVRLVP